MKKTLAFLAAIVSAAVMTGCTTVDTARNFRNIAYDDAKTVPQEHIHVRITGFYMFFCLPIITGSQQANKTSFFQDNVTVHNAVAVLCKEARGEGANRITDLSSTSSKYDLLLFGIHTVTASATALP